MKIAGLVSKFGPPKIINGIYVFNNQFSNNFLTIRSSGAENILVLPQFPLRGKIDVNFRSCDSCVFISSEFTRATILMGYGCVLYIGEETSFTTPATFTLAESKDVYVGPRSMFAENVYVSNSDGHRIFSHDGVRLNAGKDIVIGEHVWIGRSAEILKGAFVHSGSIVGARSLVSSEIPPNTICVGIPAKVIHERICFERNTTLGYKTMDAPLASEITIFDKIDIGKDSNFSLAKSTIR